MPAYLPTYLPTCIPTYLPTYLPNYLPTHLPAYLPTYLTKLTADLDMGCYAGKRRHLPWFFLAVMLLAQQGKRIFLHGTHEPDSKRLYLKEVLPQIGFDVAQDSGQARIALDTFGFAYMDLKHINPQLDDIIQLREQFGLRSCANTLARMLNPSNATHSLQGIFHNGNSNGRQR